MLEQIRAALDEVTQPYRDTRFCVCQVAATSLEGDLCRLAGSVLDTDTVSGVMAGLTACFPQVTWDASAIEVLRAATPRLMSVATNVTGLYARPSFLAEQLSQLLSGSTVELLREEGRWGFVRQTDGYLGWAYQPYLSQTPAPECTHVVCAPVALLQSAPCVDATLVGRLLAGTGVQVQATVNGWAQLALAGGVSGWLPIADLRAPSEMPFAAHHGAEPDGILRHGEAHADAGLACRAQMCADAVRFIGVPYLWGGCTALGIDCSGFVQLLHRLSGIIIPRDADLQFDAGLPVEPPFQPGDLLFFGETGGQRTMGQRQITHVGMSLGGWHIIHASRSRNGVHEDHMEAVEHLRESFIAGRTMIGPAL